MKVRNITDETLLVPQLGRAVDPDEVVTVPAHMDGNVWPEATWEVVEAATPDKPRRGPSKEQ